MAEEGRRWVEHSPNILTTVSTSRRGFIQRARRPVTPFIRPRYRSWSRFIERRVAALNAARPSG